MLVAVGLSVEPIAEDDLLEALISFDFVIVDCFMVEDAVDLGPAKVDDCLTVEDDLADG
jgi:hypothetical protein